MAVQVLCQIHHTIIIGICLIELHQSELRIVAGIQTLVPEYSSDLINTFHSTNNQTFQIKLQRNTKLEVFVQCVEMCLKRSCRRSACVCHKHRSLNFQESLRIQVFPDAAQNFRTFDKCIFYLAVHDQIHISLSVSCICICQSVEFLRKHLQTLGKQLYAFCMNRDLSCLCLENSSSDSYDITDIKLLKIFIVVFTDIVSRNVRLDVSFQILNVAEGRFSHHTFLHDTSRYGNFFIFQFLKMILDFLAVMCHIIFCNQKRVLSSCLKLRQFLTAHLSKLIQILILRILLLSCHFFHSFFLSDRYVLPYDTVK